MCKKGELLGVGGRVLCAKRVSCKELEGEYTLQKG